MHYAIVQKRSQKLNLWTFIIYNSVPFIFKCFYDQDDQ